MAGLRILAERIEYLVESGHDRGGQVERLASFIAIVLDGRQCFVAADPQRMGDTPWDNVDGIMALNACPAADDQAAMLIWHASAPSSALWHAIVDSSAFAWDGVWLAPGSIDHRDAVCASLARLDVAMHNFTVLGEVLVPIGDGNGVIWSASHEQLVRGSARLEQLFAT